MKRHSVLSPLFLAVAALVAGATNAQTAAFPSKKVTIVSPFAAGSGPDVGMRAAADALAKKWGQPVVIENKPGGNGFISMNAFKSLPKDPHNMFAVDMTHVTTHPFTFNRLPYDPDKDLALVRVLFQNEFFVTVAENSPYKNFEQIVSEAKAKPGTVTYGSWFTGSPGHLGGLKLAYVTDTDMTHVAYKETSQLYGDVARSELNWAIGSMASTAALRDAGKIRYIATTGKTRSNYYPQLPVLAEVLKSPDAVLMSWVGLALHGGTDMAVRNQISQDIREVLNSPDMRERYKTMGYDALDLSPAELQAYVLQERQSWKKIIEKAKLKLD